MSEGVNLTIKELIELHGQVLAAKMDRVERKVDALQLDSDRLGRGEFTAAQIRAIDARIDEAVETRTDRTWSNRDRIMGVASVMTAISMFALSTIIALRGVIL